MKMSDIIEEFIISALASNEGVVELKRNELAGHFSCVPSQINYVISTRFTNQRGYIVESKRGGGGSVTIRQINIGKNEYISYLLESIGDEIDYQTTKSILRQLLEYQYITVREANMISAALSDNVMSMPIKERNALRAQMLKNMIVVLG